MFRYYFSLALRSLRRNPMLTALMIAAIGVGISASMTTVTIYRGINADPIPRKAGQLFVPQIDNWGPHPALGSSFSDHLQDQLSYIDAKNLMALHGARRQAAMYQTDFVLVPKNSKLRPFNVFARATYRDFFSMFAVPFQYGGTWTAADDNSGASVTVISHALNDKLYGGSDSVGKHLRLSGHIYRIIGVLEKWHPIPRFYYLEGDPYGKTEDVFVPFTRGVEEHLGPTGNFNCNKREKPGWQGLINSDCDWIQFWVELRTPSEVAAYRALLVNYAAQQRRLGRFHWPPRVQLRNVRQWLSYHHLVSPEIRILVLLSFAFLVVCLLNASALMLARLVGRAGDIGVRRALGASRWAVALQCITESAAVGGIGGLLGLSLTMLSFAGLRTLLSSEGRPLLHLDLTDAEITIVLAVAVTMLVGLYPTWKACRFQPASQLKTL